MIPVLPGIREPSVPGGDCTGNKNHQIAVADLILPSFFLVALCCTSIGLRREATRRQTYCTPGGQIRALRAFRGLPRGSIPESVLEARQTIVGVTKPPNPFHSHSHHCYLDGEIIMLFNQNLISAGRLSPSSSLQGIMGDLYRGTRTKRSMGGISSSGIAIDIPNLVATGEFIKEIDVRHEWLCEQDWCSHSSKFPGFSVVYPGTSFLPPSPFLEYIGVGLYVCH